MSSAEPVTDAASSDARNATSAMSSGWSRCGPTAGARRKRLDSLEIREEMSRRVAHEGRVDSSRPAAIHAGPVLRKLSAIPFVSEITAPLAAEYASRSARGRRPLTDAVLTIDAAREALRCGMTARERGRRR